MAKLKRKESRNDEFHWRPYGAQLNQKEYLRKVERFKVEALERSIMYAAEMANSIGVSMADFLDSCEAALDVTSLWNNKSTSFEAPLDFVRGPARRSVSAP